MNDCKDEGILMTLGHACVCHGRIENSGRSASVLKKCGLSCLLMRHLVYAVCDFCKITHGSYNMYFFVFISVKNKLSYAYASEFPYRNNHILECEFYLLENLDCCLVVYQPYRLVHIRVTVSERSLYNGGKKISPS